MEKPKESSVAFFNGHKINGEPDFLEIIDIQFHKDNLIELKDRVHVEVLNILYNNVVPMNRELNDLTTQINDEIYK